MSDPSQTTHTRKRPAPRVAPLGGKAGLGHFLAWAAGKTPTNRLLNRLKIGTKLNLAFAILVALTLMIIGISFIANQQATSTITRANDVRVPAALASLHAETDLLRLLADTRGYLFLNNEDLYNDYVQHSAHFDQDLQDLDALSANFSLEEKLKLDDVKAYLAQWKPLQKQMFDLRDDQLAREPAYRILATTGSQLGGTVLLDTQSLIEAQALREPSADTVSLLKDMANFQVSFAAMLGGLRGYVTTRNHIYRVEYESNLTLNGFAWDRLTSQRALLTPSQQTTLDRMAQNRDAFLRLPDQMFTILEGDHWREDLYLFQNQALPIGDKILQGLDEITADQQTVLTSDLAGGRRDLGIATNRSRFGGVVALLLALWLSYVFRQNIVAPIRRLTGVADQIRAGDLTVEARVESRDEVGALATTFNAMTRQLRRTLRQVTAEKKRADDLLHVVIPIGVALSAEKDFNQLIENIVVQAKSFCHATAGILYLRTADNHLQIMIWRNDRTHIALGGRTGQEIVDDPLPLYDPISGEPKLRTLAVYAALQAVTVNIPDSEKCKDFDFQGDKRFAPPGGTTIGCTSYLTIPLISADGTVIGVLELADAQDPDTGQLIPFDANLQQMMESYSSLAIAALEAYLREQGLKQQITQLRIEIDEVRRTKQVEEIVGTDYFQALRQKAQQLRIRSEGSAQSARSPAAQQSGEGSRQSDVGSS